MDESLQDETSERRLMPPLLQHITFLAGLAGVWRTTCAEKLELGRSSPLAQRARRGVSMRAQREGRKCEREGKGKV